MQRSEKPIFFSLMTLLEARLEGQGSKSGVAAAPINTCTSASVHNNGPFERPSLNPATAKSNYKHWYSTTLLPCPPRNRSVLHLSSLHLPHLEPLPQPLNRALPPSEHSPALQYSFPLHQQPLCRHRPQSKSLGRSEPPSPAYLSPPRPARTPPLRRRHRLP